MYILNKLNDFFTVILENSKCKNSTNKLRLMHFLWLNSLGALTCILFFPYSYFYQSNVIAILNILLITVMGGSIILLYIGFKPQPIFKVTNILFLFLLVLLITHPVETKARLLWTYTYPIATIFLFGYKEGVKWSLLMLLSVIFVITSLDEIHALISTSFLIRFCVTYLSVVCVVSWIEYYKNKFQIDLEQEIKRREELEEKLLNLAHTDELTGLLNRRYFWKQGVKELERAKRYDYSVSLGVLDIDYFKSINDKYGHLKGDKVLKIVSKHCKQILRSTDLLARVGGEEFAFLLVHATSKKAEIKFEKLRKSIEELNVKLSEEEIDLTVSIGVSTLKNKKQTLEQLYSNADEMLYKAKNKGRNQVVIFKD